MSARVGLCPRFATLAPLNLNGTHERIMAGAGCLLQEIESADGFAAIMAYLPNKKDLFAFARTCWLATRALLSGPVNGMPTMYVSRAVLYEGAYYIEYQDSSEVDVLPVRARAGPLPRLVGHAPDLAYGSLPQRMRTHFLVVYTYNRDFLALWCGALALSFKC